MTNTWLDKIQNATYYESADDFVAGECMSYQDMADMARELLSFFCDSEHDEMFADVLSRMVRDYLDEVV